MDAAKGKSVTTSVPSISVRFNASAEEIEELYQTDSEDTDKLDNETRFGNLSVTGASDLENTSLSARLLPERRSPSVDEALTTQDTSDRWKFFSDIKGKLAKNLEEKITEFKSRNQDVEGSPKKTKLIKDVKQSKENKESSTSSESEELSESSISKTCGVSTTEGVEMSSDDDSPSIDKDKEKPEKSVETNLPPPSTSVASAKKPQKSSLRQRFRVTHKKATQQEGNADINTLENIHEINTGNRAPSFIDEDIESGVDALEDDGMLNLDKTRLYSDASIKTSYSTYSTSELKNDLTAQIANMELDDDDVLNIQRVSGSEVRRLYFTSDDNVIRSYFAPYGYVDLRDPRTSELSWFYMLYSYRYLISVLVAMVAYGCCLFFVPVYVMGLIAGVALTLIVISVTSGFGRKDSFGNGCSSFHIPTCSSTVPILEIPAIKEYQPVRKYEGWINEYPDVYDPKTYHISQTQSVFVRLQGNLLRLSHTRSNIPKRAMWNEPKHRATFTHHRIYNLLGARVDLVPEGLHRKRHWNKKYPICIMLNKEQMTVEYPASRKNRGSNASSADKKESGSDLVDNEESGIRKCGGFLRRKKVGLQMQPQVFSKLTEEEEGLELESESSRPSSPSPIEEATPDFSTSEDMNENLDVDIAEEELVEVLPNDRENDDDDLLSLDDWSLFTSPELEFHESDSPEITYIYLFGRTDREKEDWFRRFRAATHKGVDTTANSGSSSAMDVHSSVSDTLKDAAAMQDDYFKYMAKIYKSSKHKKISRLDKSIVDGGLFASKDEVSDVIWLNALMGRIIYDCINDAVFTMHVKERIQRKLSSVKLPYFVEQLILTELSLGNTSPQIKNCSKPVLDDRGLWVDLDITYEGMIILSLQTKLNLMKLKERPIDDIVEEATIAKWQSSDAEDTAESSTDDDAFPFLPTPTKVLDDSGIPVPGLGGTSNRSKKFIKMVDKIADSKFFKAATENRYIKKAMEGVSNTDLGLKVEVKSLVGTLVLNIPPPPSDRIWVGFRPTPKLHLVALPAVGEKNISYTHLTGWIEKKLLHEFQKVLVLPNMEDIRLSMMSSRLPL